MICYKRFFGNLLFLTIFSLNVFIILIPIQDMEFLNSDDFRAQFLREFGFRVYNNKKYNSIQRLRNTSITNPQNIDINPFKPHFKQSEYAIPGWADTRWKYRKNITIDHTKVVSDVANFPVLIDLFDHDLQTNAQASGNDIMFADVEGNILDHEIEYYTRIYNSTHSHLVSWVRLNLSSSQDTKISMYYGNPSIANQENTEGVWNDNYKGVWHLKEVPAGTTDEIKDSTANDNDGYTVGLMSSNDLITCKIGKGLELDGSNDMIIMNDSLSLDSVNDEGTLSIWLNWVDPSDDRYQRVMVSSNTFPDRTDGLEWSSQPDGDHFFYPWAGNWDDYNLITNPFMNSYWHYVVVTLDWATKDVDIFIDGTSMSFAQEFVPTNWTQCAIIDDWLWGGHPAFPASYFNGSFDEIRVSDTVRSIEWIQTEYNNQNDPNNFFSVSSEEKSPTIKNWAFPQFSYRKNITIQASKVSADLINFPVLIDIYDTDLQNDSQASGKDIIFTDTFGNQLDHEIEDYNQNSTHAHLVAWIRMNLSSTEDTTIHMYFGNPSASNSENPASLWDSNYSAVWHLSEVPNDGDLGSYEDSTVNDNDGTPQNFEDGGGGSADAKGIIDGAVKFGGDRNDYITVLNPINTDPTVKLTVSVWVKKNSSSQGEELISRGDSYVLRVWATGRILFSKYYDKTWMTMAPESINISDNNWHYIVGGQNSTGCFLYLDGNLIDSNTNTNPINYSLGDTLEIGRHGDGNSGYNFSGIIDEVRISRIGRSAAWIATEYENQKNPNSFYSIGSKETYIGDPWAYKMFRFRKNIIIDADQVGLDWYDADWQYCKRTTVIASSADIPSDYTVSLTFDHATLVSAGKSRTDGNDIRVVYWNGTSWTELDRILDPGSLWNTNSTKIWFKTQATIPASLSDNNYYLYYGNPSAKSPPTDASKIFFFYDGFESGNFNAWNNTYTSSGDTVSVNNSPVYTGAYASEYYVDTSDGPGSVYAETSFSGQQSFHAIIHTYISSPWSNDGYIANIQFYGDWSGSSKQVGSITWQADREPYIQIYDPVNDTYSFYMGNTQLTLDEWHRLEIKLILSSTNGRVELWQDGIQTVNESNLFIPHDNITNQMVGIYWKQSNTGEDTIYVDDCINKLWVDPEPTTVLGTEMEQSLTNFPLLIDLFDSELNNNDKVQADGDDIIFTDALGTKLDHEIELFDQVGNGTHAHLIAWVRIPNLSSIKDTNITMYYGNNAVGNQEDPEGVWIDYVGVWHLSEASGNADDSTQYDTTATASNMNYQAPGIMGYTFNWDEASRLSMGAPADGHLDFGTGNFTISFWINVDEDTGSSQCFMFKGAPTMTGYCLQTDNSPVTHYRAIVQSPTAVEASPSNFSFDEWNYIVMRLDRVTDLLYIYSNATEDDTADASALGDIDNFWPLQFPRDSTTSDMDGLLDEIRLSNLSRTLNWITTEYNNQKDPDSFCTVDDEEEYIGWWADASFKKRKDLVIDHTEFGSTVADELEDFPFLVDLYDSDLKTKVQSNGADILFVDEEGRKLNHEIELFDQTGNGTHAHLLAWVKIPKLRLNDSTIISIYYYNPELTKQENPEGVWTDEYLGVWHLADDPTGPIYDSTSKDLDGTSYGSMTSDDQVTGQIDGSLDFDGVNDYINCSDPARERFNASERCTCSVWILVDTDPGANYPNLVSDEAFDGSDGWDFYWWSDSIHVWSCEAQTNVVSSGTLNYDQWYFAAFTYDNGVVELFINGSSVDTGSNTFTDSTGDFLIGAYIPESYYLDGVMDEVHISNVIRSDDWIQVEFKNQFDPDSLYSVGPEVIFDETPPEILNFGVDDPGTGLGKFWAELTDDSGIDSVEVTINNTKYAISWNGTYWVYDFTVESYQGYYEYLISNASDTWGNHRTINSSLKYYTFNKDTVNPNVLDWEYYVTLGPYGTFKANVTDSWGEIDTVQVNVTTYNMQAFMRQYATFGSTSIGYLNDTLEMPNGEMYFQIIVNDTAGNEYVSPTHLGDVFTNHPPIVENLTFSPAIHWSNCSLTLTYDYYDEDDHSEAGTKIRWYKKNDSVFLLEPTYNDTKVIPASALEVGNQWYVNVTPKDGELFGETNMSAIITILNTPPAVSNVVVFYSGSGPYTTSTLDIDYTYDDHEGDAEDLNNREVEWYRNGTHLPTLDNNTSILPENTIKGETWYYRVRVSDGTDYSGWVTSDTVLIHNSKPQAVNLSLPSNPTTTTDLVAAWDMTDADGDSEELDAVIIYWYKDGENQPAWTNLTTIGAGNTSKGESWRFEIRVFDGENYSALTPLNPPVVILNSAPTVSNVVLTPTTPVTTDGLTVTRDYSDDDNDPEGAPLIRWYLGNIHQPAYDGETTLPSSATTKEDSWHVGIQVFDGTAYSAEVNSSQVFIQNTPPAVNNLALSAAPKTTTDLVASWTATDNDTSDSLTFNVTWYLDGEVNCSWLTSANSATLSASNTTKGDDWSFTIQAYDGEAYSNIGSLGYNRTILNTAPVVANLTITSNPTTTDPLLTTFDYTDADVADNTSLVFNITWYCNGLEQSSLANTTSVGAGNTTKSQFWWFTVQAYDGESFSLKLESAHVQILNTAPDISNLVITPLNPTTTTDLNTSWDDADADSDSLTYIIRWYIVGVGLQPAYNDLQTIPASATVKGQTWYYNLTAFDGDTYSPEKSSPQIDIQNSPPVADSFEVTTNPTTVDDLVASWSATDNDTIDSLTFNVTWYLNGEVNCSCLTSSTSATLDAGNTTKAQNWNVTVQAYDGEAHSNILFIVTPITILNSKPTVTNPSFNDTSPDEDDDFHITYTFVDVDGEDVEELDKIIVYWYVNWEYNASFQNQTTIYAANTTATEVWYYIIRVFDGEAYSDNVTSEQGVYIGGGSTNIRPMATDLTLSPASPQTHEALIANYTFSDVDEDPEVAYEIRWYRNSGTGFQLQSQYNNLFIVPASVTFKGQEWNFTVRVFDGIQWSELNVSTTITITNTNPEVSNLGITSNPKTTDDLVANWDTSDNDSDSLTFIFTWYVNGVENATFANKTVIGAGNTTKGEKWYFTVQAYDGEGLSTIISLAENITILNTAPMASSLTIPANPATLDDLVAAWDYFDIDNDLRDDALAQITWFKNGENQTALVNQKIIGASNTSKNQVWWFTVRVSDGQDYSGLYESAHIQILNSIPVVENLTISILNPKTTDELVAQWDDNDNDSDILSYTIKWYIVGVGLQSAYNDLTTVPASATSKGETWYYTLKAFDGSEYSSEETLSPGVLILNTVPIVEDLTLTMDPHTTDDLVTSWDTSDNDSDSLIFIITWYVNGLENTTFANKTLIEAENTTKGEKWYYTVQAYDGEGVSSIMSLAANVTILNTAPTASNLILTPNPTTLDDLTAAWDYFDIDNDPRDDGSARITWFKNGLNQTALANQKTVGATNTSKNQVWWFTVRVFDGENYSIGFYESVHISIQNTVPYSSSALPLPTDPTKATGLVLSLPAILATLSDPDPSDDLEVVQICWYKEGVLQGTLNDSLTVPSTRLTKGERWNYSIVPFDGVTYGAVCVSTEIIILNSRPTIINTYFTETTVTTISDLVISFQAEDADGDSITISGVHWYRYDDEIPGWVYNATYDDYVSLPAAATTKGESWKYELAVSDGTDQSVWREAAKEADIINSKPRVDPFSITLIGGTTTSEPLQVTYTWYDDDPGDSNTQTIITWENSGDYLEDTYSTTLSADETTAGERWWVTITPYDGEAEGASVNSKRYGISIIIGNTPPSLAPEDIEINGELNGTEYQGTSFGTVFNLNLHYTASDLDGDQGVPAYGLSIVDGFAVGSEYWWYRNRSGSVTLLSALNNEITIPFYYTQKGDIWWVQVCPRDFYGDFGLPQNSSQIIIGNTAPQIVELHWVRLTYYTTNNLVFGYTFYDYDTKDTQQGAFIHWYRNGTHVPSFDNTTTIMSQFTQKGEAWYANISVFDGESYSIWYYLLNITIQNSPPTAASILISPLSPNTTQPLNATWAFNDADNDSENHAAALIQWYRNGILVANLTDSQTVPFTLTNRKETWYFTLRVNDGYNYSITIYKSNTITIINSAPIAVDLQINDGADIYTTDALVLTWNFTDFDPLDIEDPSSTLILWYLNGIEQSAFTNATEIPAAYVVKGQQWMVAIRVCDNGGLWSEFLNSSLVVIKNSVPTLTIHGTAHPEFIVEDEVLDINSSFYSYMDEDGDENHPIITWYCNEELRYQHIWVLSANETVPGDVWYYTIQPFDGTDFGAVHTSPEISIESRPVIHSFIATALPDIEGHYKLEINVTDSQNAIKQVEFLLNLNITTELAPFIVTSPISPGSTLWLLDYRLDRYSYLGTPTLVTATVVTEVSYSITYEIHLIETFTFTLEDKAPPRVLNAYFEMNDELNPTNLTFYAQVQDLGSGVAEVILSYYFRPSDELNQTGGNGAALLQDDLEWLDVPMTVQVANDTGGFLLYMVTVDFVQATSNLDIIYRISTKDHAGNSNTNAFDIQDYPQRIIDQRFIYQPPGLPEWVLLVAGLVIFMIFIGSIVYVKFIRKPELVGLDKELVLAKISDITDAEVMASLDTHTIGVVVSFFDQRHGPIPIIIIPEILKDNFTKLVDLSDRSFSGTGFADDFGVEIPSSYDFVLSHGVRTSVMSFGFALERPDSRGGQENLTCNIIVHQDLFPLVQSFQKELQRKVHSLHVRMDKNPSEKTEIRKEVFELRKFVSNIILSYASIYGTTELLEED